MIGDPKKPHKKKKRRAGTDHKYLKWLKTQPCCACGSTDISIPAHQRILGRGGTGIKPPDKDALPLCYWCHSEEHEGAVSFWGKKTKAKTKEFVQGLCDNHIKRYYAGPAML